VMPPLNSSATSQSAAPSTGSKPAATNGYAQGGGFTLPSGIVPPQAAKTSTPGQSNSAVAAVGLPPTSAKPSPGQSTPLPSETASAPSFQTASNASPPKSTSVTPPSNSQPSTLGGASSSSDTVLPTGYMPGSTGASSGYPAGPSMVR
jgi:hypothetical protein